MHMCDMTHSCVRHDSFVCVIWLLCMFVMIHLMDFRNWRHWKTTCCCRFTAAWYLRFTWRGMSHVTWHDSFLSRWTADTRPQVVFQWCQFRKSIKWVTTNICTSHVTHTNESCRTYEWVMSHIRMSHVTHMNEDVVTRMDESCHTCKWRGVSHICKRHVTHMNEEVCHTHAMKKTTSQNVWPRISSN